MPSLIRFLPLVLVTTVLAQGETDAATSRRVAITLPPLGGVATVDDVSPNAFGYPARVLTRKERRRFLVGNSFFKQNWIESPASASARDGLGPLFNARSCSACHLRDGRSAPPAPADRERHGLLMRIGVAVPGAPDAPHPIYGGQLQDAAVQGVAPEVRVDLRYEVVGGAYADGERYELLRPIYGVAAAAYGAIGENATFGPRTAPHLIGLGLLEAVPAASLARLADPQDADGDGVSGRVHWLDAKQRVPGRFGWKATQPDVASQVAAAFVNDMGITSARHPREVLTTKQREVLGFVGDEIEITASSFAKVVFYTQTLAVPAQRDAGAPEVRHGARIFTALGCASCHVPILETGRDAMIERYAGQVIRPYTDLLLHDLGPELADGKRDGDARPSEWRTPPLWGLGLLETISGHTRLLHDGRARGFAEAILWHGGEATAAREAFRAANVADRAALLAFLRSL